MAVDICIRGAGVVGMSLALLLARARIRVGLVRPPAASACAEPDIRAFALNTASRELLTSLRAWPELACAVQHMRVQGDGDSENGATPGRVSFDAAAMGAPALAHIVDASLLEQRLHAALSFAPDITLLDAPVPAALTVICEGQRSASRTATGLVFEQSAYGHTAIAATLETELPHQATAWQWMQGTPGNTGSAVLGGNAEGTGYKGEVCALLPRQTGAVSGSGAAGNSVALVWSVEHAHAQKLLALDDAQFAVQLQTTCASALGAMRLTSRRAAWPLQLAQASRWVGVGLSDGVAGIAEPQAAWALAGDAAHAVHPLAGQGLNLGLADAAALARILSGKEYFRSYGDMRLLRRYERERSGDALALRLATDSLQRLFAVDHPAVRALRNAGMRGFNVASPLKNFVMRQAMGA
jgi:ubiquinone biosynthesis UbiH/UbiF/VisC/COQ6 family hydroxylase